MKKYLLFIVFGMLIFSTFSQNTGYLGRKFILKANVLNGIDFSSFGGEVEYVLSRKLTVSAGVNTSKFQPEDYTFNEVNEYGNIAHFVYPQIAKSIRFHGGVKYFFDRISPAPQGLFTSFEIGIGLAQYDIVDKTSQFFDFDYDYSFNTRYAVYALKETETLIKHASYYLFLSSPSVGYQIAFAKRFLIEGKVATEFFITHQYDDYDFKFVRSNTFSIKNEQVIYGPSAYLKLGILIF